MTVRTAAAGVLVLAALGAVRAQGQRDSPAPRSVTGAAELAVLVMTDEPQSRPARRVSVSLQAGRLDVPRTAVTGDDGRVVFGGLPAGNYVVSAFKPGYVRTFYGSRIPGRGPGIAVALVDGQRADVRIRMARGAVVSGIVRTPGGRPAAGVMVQAVGRGTSRTQQTSMFGDNQASMGTTDDRGVYRIYGLAPGDYAITARYVSLRDEVRVVTADELQWADRAVAGGTGPPADIASPPAPNPPSAFSPVFYPGTTVAGEASVLTLRPGEERLGVDFTLSLVRTAQIRGRLIDGEGRPQSGQSVSLRSQSTTGTDLLDLIDALTGQTARTGADGSFTLNGVRPGRYVLMARVTVRSGGGSSARAAGSEMAAALGAVGGTHWASEELTIAGVDIPDLTMILRPGMTVSGRVVYEGTMAARPKNPVTGLTLSPAPTATGAAGFVPGLLGGAEAIRVAEDGTFATTGLAPGKYRVVSQAMLLAEVAGDAIARAGGWILKSAMAGGTDVADAPLEVRAGENISDVVITFTDRPTELNGTVFDQAGRATADFPIVVFSTSRAYWTLASRRVQLVRPASDGRFSIVGLPAGEYFVAAVTAVENDQLADPAFLDQLAAMSFRISLKEGEKRAQDLRLGGG